MRTVALILLLTLGACESGEPAAAPVTRTFVAVTDAADPALAELEGVEAVAVAAKGGQRDATAAALAVLMNDHDGPTRLVAMPGATPAVLLALPRLRERPGRVVLIDPPAVDGRAVPAGFDLQADLIDTYVQAPAGIDGATTVERVGRDRRLFGTLARRALDGDLPERAALARGEVLWRLVGADPRDETLWLRLKVDGRSMDVLDGEQPMHLTLAPGATVEVTPHRERAMLPDAALASRTFTLDTDEPPTSVTADGYDVRLTWQRVTPIAPHAPSEDE